VADAVCGMAVDVGDVFCGSKELHPRITINPAEAEVTSLNK